MGQVNLANVKIAGYIAKCKKDSISQAKLKKMTLPHHTYSVLESNDYLTLNDLGINEKIETVLGICKNAISKLDEDILTTRDVQKKSTLENDKSHFIVVMSQGMQLRDIIVEGKDVG